MIGTFVVMIGVPSLPKTIKLYIKAAIISGKEEVLALDSETRPLTSISTLSNENDIIEIRAHPTNSILSAEGDVQSTNACFFMQPDSLLSGVAPIEKGIGLSEVECLTLCARAPSCRSLNYGASISTCEVFDQIEEPPAVVKHRLGYTYYTPKHHNLKGCMKDILSSDEDLSPSHDPVIRAPSCRSLNYGASISTCEVYDQIEEPPAVVKHRLGYTYYTPKHHNLKGCMKADCLNNTAVLFVRSADSHYAIPSSPNTVLNVNEDDCLFICLRNKETVLNCILNDASAKTNPESTAEEDKSIVDYFGVDDCYGLPEIADTRQKHLKSFPLTVEDDVIGGAQTPG
ncbi:PAN domain protein [Oesophagostomum dentatum]|uniref:PAN domain protein n=1 Tax=Oesophagostomum dentatum TaxID=61180 RepID=A0A0B1T7X3_OESDE|nr:PAN domain protein [Oesophagostomum dentatum]